MFARPSRVAACRLLPCPTPVSAPAPCICRPALEHRARLSLRAFPGHRPRHLAGAHAAGPGAGRRGACAEPAGGVSRRPACALLPRVAGGGADPFRGAHPVPRRASAGGGQAALPAGDAGRRLSSRRSWRGWPAAPAIATWCRCIGSTGIPPGWCCSRPIPAAAGATRRCSASGVSTSTTKRSLRPCRDWTSRCCAGPAWCPASRSFACAKARASRTARRASRSPSATAAGGATGCIR